MKCANQPAVEHDRGAAAVSTAGPLGDSDPGPDTSAVFTLATAEIRVIWAIVAGVRGSTLRASVHRKACPAFEHMGRRPAAVERPINAVGVPPYGVVLDVPYVD